jgi:diguanylate cyclase (GGDEF)-like protein
LSRPALPAAPAAPAPRALATWPLARALALLTGVAALLSAIVAGGLSATLSATVAPGFGVVWPAVAGALAGTLLLGVPAALVLLRVVRDTARVPMAALVDSSTGASSREVLLDLAAREIARSRRYGGGAAMLLVEVDRFHRLGTPDSPDAGEAVLRELARHVAPGLRGADVLARWRGAQLAVFLVHADPTGALDVAERIREGAERLEVPWHPQRLRFTVSVGVAQLASQHLTVQALLDDADDALVAAREAGGNCVRAAPQDREMPPVAGLPPMQGDNQRTRPGA